jgi:replicative DNA helicase
MQPGPDPGHLTSLPPHSIQSEQELLSACLLGGAPEAAAKLTPDKFYRTAHQTIFGAIVSLLNDDIDVSLVSVHNRLVETGGTETAGGASYLARLQDTVPAAASIDYHCNIILDRAAKRKIIADAAKLSAAAYDNKPMDELIRLSEKISPENQSHFKNYKRTVGMSNVYDAEAMVKEYQAYITTLSNNRFITGLDQIDMRIRGVAGGETLWIIARAGAYKTALLQNMLRNYVNNSAWGAVFFSLEMPVASITERYISMMEDGAGRWIEGIFKDKDKSAEIERITGRVKRDLKRFFVVPVKTGLTDMARYIRLIERHRQVKIGVVGIDYAGLVDATGRGEYERMTKVAIGTKDLAKELDIPLVVLAQLSRRGESGKTEVSMDMARGSGAIEEAADFLLGQWQDNGLLVSKILKNRKGPAGSKWVLDVDRDSFKIGGKCEAFVDQKPAAAGFE